MYNVYTYYMHYAYVRSTQFFLKIKLNNMHKISYYSAMFGIIYETLCISFSVAGRCKKFQTFFYVCLIGNIINKPEQAIELHSNPKKLKKLQKK